MDRDIDDIGKAFALDNVAVRLVKTNEPLLSDHALKSPMDIVRELSKMMSQFDREVLGVINFKTDMTPINVHFASMGALNQAIAHPREIFKASILSNAANMILIHCHPSGSLSPSRADTVITDRMAQACEIMGINLVDHIIVGGDGESFFSFHEKDVMPIPRMRYESDYKELDFGIAAERGTYQSQKGEKPVEEKKENQSVKEIVEKLEQGLKDLFESDKYKAYLDTMSRFHNYSYNNNILIAMQKPDATLVAGFQQWQRDFDRHVNKGERGIKIIAPAPYRIKKMVDVIDPKTQRPVMGEDGRPKREEQIVTIPSFKQVTVFDVSQTDGKPIPEMGVKELLDPVDGFQDLMKAVERTAPVPIVFAQIEGGAKGFFSPGQQRITINEGMSESQTVKTAIHEMAHSLLHDKDHMRMQGIKPPDEKTEGTIEVESESIAYTVCQHFGIDTSEYSFGYVAGWSSDKDTPELKASMDTICKTSDKMINDIEGVLKEIKLEKEKAAEKSMESTFEIWQLKNIPENRELAFESMDHLKTAGRTVEKENYDLVYSGKLEDGVSLEDLYTKFNIDHPEDFRGHSMSVSDVVIIQKDGERHAHYVDSFGFEEVPEFLADKALENVKSEEIHCPPVAKDEKGVSEPDMKASLFVAECAEFHNYGEYHEGIGTVEAALEIYDSIPADRLSARKSIGIIVPEPREPEKTIEIDIMVGNRFDLDMLQYVPDILSNESAVEMIAELIDRFPEHEILGVMPEQIRQKIELLHDKEPSTAYDLAAQIDDFMYGFDPYGYKDQVEDRDAQVETLAKDIENGEADYIRMYLAEIINEQDGTADQLVEAQQLIEKIDDYKPLAKIEEQMEENYNHIDGVLNNLKKPSEERKEEAEAADDKQEEALDQAESESGRKTEERKPQKGKKKPSLKKRLDEKKELVIGEPGKPAPEKQRSKARKEELG